MIKQFYTDLKNAKAAEELVRDTLASLAPGMKFKCVGDQPEYYHKGDIIAYGEDRMYFIEVKDDSRIADTGNVLCEERVFFREGNYFQKGFMYSDYEIFCVVSQPERKMYFIDFNVLKQIYKKGEYKEIHHPQQYSECYLLELCRIKQYGALIKVIDY